MDAGPNVKVLVQKDHLDKVKTTFSDLFSSQQVISAFAGPGMTIIE